MLFGQDFDVCMSNVCLLTVKANLHISVSIYNSIYFTHLSRSVHNAPQCIQLHMQMELFICKSYRIHLHTYIVAILTNMEWETESEGGWQREEKEISKSYHNKRSRMQVDGHPMIFPLFRLFILLFRRIVMFRVGAIFLGTLWILQKLTALLSCFHPYFAFS